MTDGRGIEIDSLKIDLSMAALSSLLIEENSEELDARCKLPAASHCNIFPQTKCSARKLHWELPLRRFAPLVTGVLNRIVLQGSPKRLVVNGRDASLF